MKANECQRSLKSPTNCNLYKVETLAKLKLEQSVQRTLSSKFNVDDQFGELNLVISACLTGSSAEWF